MNREPCARCGGGRVVCGICRKEPIDCRHLVYRGADDLTGECRELVACLCVPPDEAAAFWRAEQHRRAGLPAWEGNEW